MLQDTRLKVRLGCAKMARAQRDFVVGIVFVADT